MSARDLLLEIGMEECPARFIEPALEEMKRLIAKGLAEARLSHGEVERFGTPRRLAVLVRGVADRQSDLEVEVKGPPAKIAFSDGAPTKAAAGFAANQGVPVEALVVKETEGGAYVYAVRRETGRPAEEVLPEILRQTVTGLSFPKSMRWGAGGLRFARPIRWLVALWGETPIPFEVGGVQAGAESRGHRFLAPGPIVIPAAAAYPEPLENEGWVVADIDRRKERVHRQVEAVARSVEGEAAIDPGLLDEVAHLVEYPTALLGSFDPAYLSVPAEILVTTMKEHQRYFPVVRADGSLMPHFVAVRNGTDDHLDVVRAGNEKVLSARLADARFFYEEDLKTPLAERAEELRSVLFQEELGSVWDKVERIRRILRTVGASLDPAVVEHADRAAFLAKADLVTQVVYEFPELQGTMGREYALKSGEAPEVARAIFEHYLPRYANDQLPQSLPGVLVSLADKADTIVGCFGVGLAPTGSQDPYALRRQALGILRTMLLHPLPFTLLDLLQAAAAAYADRLGEPERIVGEVLEFFSGRLRNLLMEEGVRYDLVDAAIALGVEDVRAAVRRAKALQAAAETANFSRAREMAERARNLANKSDGRPVAPDLFETEEEKALWERLGTVREEIGRRLASDQFDAALEALASLREPVDAFFEAVLVMAEDERVRMNRLALLREVVAASSSLAAWDRVVEG